MGPSGADLEASQNSEYHCCPSPRANATVISFWVVNTAISVIIGFLRRTVCDSFYLIYLYFFLCIYRVSLCSVFDVFTVMWAELPEINLMMMMMLLMIMSVRHVSGR